MSARVHTTSTNETLIKAAIPSTTVDAPSRLMRENATGTGVEVLQRVLGRLGFNSGKVDGKFDSQVKDALKAFQTEHGVSPSGIYGPKTRDALKAALRKQAASRGPKLKQGYSGAAVKTLEERLKAKGYFDGVADGTFDAKTAKAVKALEKKAGLDVNGVAGGKVWEALGGAGAGSGTTLKLNATGPEVKILQRRLKELGLYDGPVDGEFGKVTQRAVKAFEKQNGLKEDGIVAGHLWSKLGTHALVKTQLGGPRLELGFRGAAVRILQKKLADEGVYKGPLSAKFDAATKAAVQAFEKKHGMRADGVAGMWLWAKLGGAGVGSGPRLAQGSRGEQVEVLQRKLAAQRLYKGPIDGDFGPITAAALKAFEKKRGLLVDGVAGKGVWRALGQHVVTEDLKDTWSTFKAPPHDYRRVRRDEGFINVRTQVMLDRAERFAKELGVSKPFYIVQGSYTSGVAASGTTHDGGGALDIRTWDRSREDVVKMVKALRMAGFAAWKRGYGDDGFDEVHIHAIAIGDRDLSSSARDQVQEYFAGGDGLVGSTGDGDADEAGRPIPKWARS